MTDIKLIPNQQTLEERAAKKLPLVDDRQVVDVLFDNAVCLTARVYYTNKAIFDEEWKCLQQCQKEHPNSICYVVNQYAPLSLYYCNYFHYFSNGVLVHNYDYKKAVDYIKKIKIMLSYHGYEIKQIFGPENYLQQRAYTEIMMSIDNKIKTNYAQKVKFATKYFSNKNDFVKQCFKNNNVLLTATNEEFFDVSCRDFIAVFSSGHVYISDEYEGELSFKGDVDVKKFIYKHRNLIYMNPIYVPTEYISALYKKAAEFDWFVTKEAVCAQKSDLPDNKKQEIFAFIDKLYENAQSVCVTNPRAQNNNFLETADLTSPEFRRYVLFSDGTIVLSEERYGENAEASFTLKSLHKCFPDMNFNKKFVPDYYIDVILAEMAKRQKTAAEIYIDLLKRKAKKLEKIYHIKHYESLDLVAKLGGWKNWKCIKNLSEQHARHLIAQEQDYTFSAKKNGEKWGAFRIINLLKEMNVEFHCSWETDSDNVVN